MDMIGTKSRYFKWVVVLLVAGTLVACGGKEERKAKYLEKGKAYLAEKNYDKAKIEFKNVLQIDPKDDQGFYYLGQIEEKKQNWAAAFGAYKKAVDLNPDFVDARVSLANFYLLQASAMKRQDKPQEMANALGLVSEQIKEIQSRDPENTQALTLEATLWANDGETEKAVAQLEQVIQKDPALPSAAVLLSSLYSLDDRTEAAETVLLNAIKASPDPVSLQQRLASMYASTDRPDEAEAVLRQIVKDNPDELGRSVGLASFLSGIDRLDAAEQVLGDAIAADAEDEQRYKLMVEFLASRRSKDAAIERLKQYIQQHPDMAELQMSLSQLYFETQQNDAGQAVLESVIKSQGVEPLGLRARVVLATVLARADMNNERSAVLLQEVLNENPRDNDALALKGRLALNNKNYTDAINDFRSVLKDQPDNADVLRLLATAHTANGEDVLALDTLKKGVEVNPGNIELHMALAQQLVRNNDIDGGLKQLDAVLALDKYNQTALASKFELLGRKGDAAGMAEVTGLMQAGAPDEDNGYILEARLKFAEKKYDEALAVLDKVLARKPASMPALLAKSDVLLSQKRYDDALAVTDLIIKALPESAEGHFRKARVLHDKGQPDAALQEYERALAISPDLPQILTALINQEIETKQYARAEQRLLDILENNADHRSANTLLGAVYVAQKNYAAAEKAFERQIEINPESTGLYRDLAQIRLADNRPEEAASAYQQGLAIEPLNPQLLIGLAGLREQQKNYEAAISLYEKLLSDQPDNAVSTNNLAFLLSEHRNDQASLDKALEYSAKLEKTNQPAFLDTAGWVYYRSGKYDKAAEVLGKAIAKAPDVPIFNYHLGMVYLKQGNKAAAREQLTKATAEGADYRGIEEARTALGSL
jgi:tetratricopeptide (TPR) repeat protein